MDSRLEGGEWDGDVTYSISWCSFLGGFADCRPACREDRLPEGKSMNLCDGEVVRTYSSGADVHGVGCTREGGGGGGGGSEERVEQLHWQRDQSDQLTFGSPPTRLRAQFTSSAGGDR